MATNNINVFLKVGGENFDLEVEYKIEGRYIPSTWDEPEEFPDVVIESIIDADSGKRIFEESLSQGELLNLREKLLASYED